MADTSDLINLDTLTEYDTLLKKYINDVTTNSNGVTLASQINTALAACRTACA